MTGPSRQIGIGRPSFLTEHQKTDLYDAALLILAEIGMRVHHEEARSAMIDAGCTLDDDGRVHVPATVVDAARATAPASFTVFDRAGEPAMEVGGYNAYFGTGSDLMHLYDLETGARRLSTLADVAQAARLCDALPEIDFVMSSAFPNGGDPSRIYPEQLRAMVANTTKPPVMTAGAPATVATMWRIACEVRGSADELRAKPFLLVYNQPSSPLEHPRESVDKLYLCADHGIPGIYSPAPLAGGTAPITVAGHIAQGLAEGLFGLVLHQLRAPGAPFVLGMGPAVLDMATAQSSYNAPEYLLANACFVELTKWLHLPNWGYGGTTDSQVVDAQAGIEIAQLTELSMLVGSNLNHDVGYMDFGLTGSFAQILITAEFIALTRRLLGGIEVTPETLALDVIADAGPGGDFLSKRHTSRHLRSSQWRPTLLNRMSHERWREDGARDLTEKARQRALKILAEHEPAPLDAAVAARIDDIVEKYAGVSDA